MKIIGRLGAIALVVISLSACATITRGTKQKVEFKSTPDGADVSTSTGATCVTPCTIKMKRKQGFDATFRKEGYQETVVKVESKFSGGGAAAGAGNILLGGVIGGILDGSNGSLNNLTPNPVEATLLPVGLSPAAVDAAAVEVAPVAEEPAPVAEDASTEEPTVGQ